MSFFHGFPFGDFGFESSGPKRPKKDVNTTRYYEILGISKTASQDEIKRAYRKLAKIKHPDKGGSQEEFQELQVAFDVLSDENKRKVYDTYGEEGLKEGMSGNEGEGIDIMDILNGRGRNKQRKTKSILQQLEVSLEDIYLGKDKFLEISRRRICNSCKGTGAKDPKADTKCKRCEGKGVVVQVQRTPFGIMQTQSDCPDCGGDGFYVREKDKCHQCKGQRIKKDTKLIKVMLDKGAPDRKRYKFEGESDEYPGYEPGDVIIEIIIKKHAKFERKGADLTYKADISLLEALTGFEMEIKHLDGRTIIVKTKPGEIIKPGVLKTVHDCGMPFYDSNARFGNLYIYFNIIFPMSLNDNQKKELKKLFPKADMEIDTDSGIKEKYSMTDFVEEEQNTFATGGNQRRKSSMDNEEDEEPRGQRVGCEAQ